MKMLFNFRNVRILVIKMAIRRTLFSFLLLLSAVARADDYHCGGCNVVFLNLDFLRSDYIGLISNSSLTPKIDQFFKNSIVFENAYATAGSTYRGNLSTFTAKDPHFYAIDVDSYSSLRQKKSLGVWNKVFTQYPSIAEQLFESGYNTISLQKGKRSGHYTQLDRGFAEYVDYPFKTLIADIFGDAKERLIKAESPWFLHVHAIPTRLHSAYFPVGRQRFLHDDIIYKPYRMKKMDYGYIVRADYHSGRKATRLAEHRIYRQQLRYADDALYEIFEYLQEIQSNTIIVFFSTHATQIGDNGIFASNGTGHEMNIRVPLFIKHPKVQKPLHIKTPVSMLDLVPTIMAFLNIPWTSGDGISLVPVLKGNAYKRDYIWGNNDKDDFLIKGDWKLLRWSDYERKLVLINNPIQKDEYKKNRQHARYIEFFEQPGIIETRQIVSSPWRLEINELRENRLYNLKDDPLETHNIAADHPSIVKELSDILDQHKDHAKREILQLTN